MSNPESQSLDLILRERRQITLPAELCQKLGLQVGDRLEVRLDGNTLMVKPKKALALRALREIQAAFAASGITEEVLQESGRKIREEIFEERYAQKTPRLS
jgi:AbrB family looped-hinge helix DNA binding protein